MARPHVPIVILYESLTKGVNVARDELRQAGFQDGIYQRVSNTDKAYWLIRPGSPQLFVLDPYFKTDFDMGDFVEELRDLNPLLSVEAFSTRKGWHFNEVMFDRVISSDCPRPKPATGLQKCYCTHLIRRMRRFLFECHEYRALSRRSA